MFVTAIALVLPLMSQSGLKDLPVGPQPTGFLSFCFSPDSKRILYSKIDDAVNFDPSKRNIWIANPDGSKPELVASGVGLAEWFNGGRSILYIKSLPSGPELCRFDLDQKTEKPFGIKLAIRSANYSGVAKRLVFTADLGNGTAQCFTSDAEGKDIRQITFGPGKAFSPLWSPDGKRIVFFRELGDSKDQIYVINSDGTSSRHVSEPSKHNFYPDFGPNGTISHTIMEDEKVKQVIIATISGKRIRQFPYRTSRLRWSPDGKKAIFVVGEFPTTALYVSDADGSNLVRIGTSH